MKVKNTMTELKNSTESFNSRLDQAEEKKSVSSKTDCLKLSSQKSKKKKEKTEESLQILWDTINKTIYTLLDSHKKDRRRKVKKAYLKK